MGEPAVTTTTLADYLGISPSNLCYHFRNKDDIVNSIFAQLEAEMDRRLSLPPDHQPGLEEVWTYLQKTADFLWRYRFLYRDINDLLARNRMLEIRFRGIVERKLAMEMCQLLAARGEFTATPPAGGRASSTTTKPAGATCTPAACRSFPCWHRTCVAARQPTKG